MTSMWHLFCVTLQVTSRMVTPGLVRLKRKYPSQWKVTRTSVQCNRNLLRKSLSTKESVLCLSKSSSICQWFFFSSYLGRLWTRTAPWLITANMLFISNQFGVQQNKNFSWFGWHLLSRVLHGLHHFPRSKQVFRGWHLWHFFPRLLLRLHIFPRLLLRLHLFRGFVRVTLFSSLGIG